MAALFFFFFFFLLDGFKKIEILKLPRSSNTMNMSGDEKI
jgi:hypothetical protein